MQIASITVSVVVAFITALVAIYLLRYEGVFVTVLLVVKSGFLITNGRISFKQPPWEIQEEVIGHKDRSCCLCEWVLIGDHVLKQFRLCSFGTL